MMSHHAPQGTAGGARQDAGALLRWRWAWPPFWELGFPPRTPRSGPAPPEAAGEDPFTSPATVFRNGAAYTPATGR
jgi:hypothetical protein